MNDLYKHFLLLNIGIRGDHGPGRARPGQGRAGFASGRAGTGRAWSRGPVGLWRATSGHKFLNILSV